MSTANTAAPAEIHLPNLNRGAEPIEAPHDTPWGTRTAYLKGPGSITVEIEQLLNRT